MAESLGSAELILTVNDTALRQGLEDARRLINSLQSDTSRTASRARSNQNTGSGNSASAGARRETKEERDLEVLKEKRFRLARRIDSLEERGFNTSRLRTQLGRLTTAYADREFTAARNISRELARQVTLSEYKERTVRRTARVAQADADASVRSARGLNRINIAGSQREVGSPIFSARGMKRGGASEQVNALTNAQKRRYSLDQQIRSLEASGVRTEKLRVQLGDATTAQARRQFGSFNQIADTLDFTLRKERDKLRVLRDQNREVELQATEGRRVGRLNASPVGGGLAYPGSPGAKAALNSEAVRIGKLNSSPVQGGTAFPGSPLAIAAEEALTRTREEAAAAAKEAEIAEGKRIGKLNALPVKGAKEIEGSPKAIAAEEALTRKREEAAAATKEAEIAEGKRIGKLNALPVQGNKNIAGSPAAKQQESRLNTAGREAESTIRTRYNNLANRANLLAAKGVDIEREIQISKQLTAAIASKDYKTAKLISAELDRQLKTKEYQLRIDKARSTRTAKGTDPDNLAEGRRIGRLNTSPVRGGTSFPGSPLFLEEETKQNKARAKTALERLSIAQTERKTEQARTKNRGEEIKRRASDAIGSGIIGGAFPALFGQGAGASLGGGLGGVGGGLIGGQFGFGLSLIGTSLGQFVDDAVIKTKTLVDALKDPIANFDALKQAALLSSKGLETNIDSLIKAGREEEAAALIRGDIAKQFGSGDEFKALQTAYDGVSRSLTKLGVSIVDGLAPALITGANAVADFIDKLSGIKLKTAGDDIQQGKEFIGDDPSRQAEFDKLFKDAGGTYGKSGKFSEGSIGAALTAYRELLKINKQLTAEERARATENAEVGEAYQRFLDLRKLEKDLIVASFSGDKLRTLELEKQKLVLEEIEALNLAPKGDVYAADQIRNEFANKRLKLEKEATQEILKQSAASVASENKITSLQEQASISRASLSLSGTGVGALQASAAYREAVRAQQNAQAALAATPGDPDALRNLKEASEAVKTASVTANTQLVEAFRSARRDAQDAATALGNAYTSLLSLRTGNQGLGKYLNAENKAALETDTFNKLLPLFNAAKAQARDSLSKIGIENFDLNFSGPTGDVNQAILDFIKTVNTDKEAQVSVERSTEDLIYANNSLIVATSELNANNLILNDTLIQVIPAIQSLASKDWNIYVNASATSDLPRGIEVYR